MSFPFPLRAAAMVMAIPLLLQALHGQPTRSPADRIAAAIEALVD